MDCDQKVAKLFADHVCSKPNCILLEVSPTAWVRVRVRVRVRVKVRVRVRARMGWEAHPRYSAPTYG